MEDRCDPKHITVNQFGERKLGCRKQPGTPSSASRVVKWSQEGRTAFIKD